MHTAFAPSRCCNLRHINTDWRCVYFPLVAVFPAMQCENGRTYKACGTVCTAGCSVKEQYQDLNCTKDCVEGCHCPDGTVLFEGMLPPVLKLPEYPPHTLQTHTCMENIRDLPPDNQSDLTYHSSSVSGKNSGI